MYKEASLQDQHLFPKMLPLKIICGFTEYLMSRLICKKGHVLFPFSHRDDSYKYPKDMFL